MFVTTSSSSSAPIKTRLRVVAVLAAIVAVGGALRLAQAWSNYAVFGPYFDPQEGYYESGVALGETGLFSPDAEGLEARAWRGPLFPAFIAVVESAFARPWPGHVAVATALLSTAAVLVIGALGFLLGGVPAGLLAAAFAALDPVQIFAVSSLNIHGFYGLAVLGLAAAAALWARKPGPKTAAAMGLSLAGSLLCRSAHILSVPLLALVAVRRAGYKAAATVLLWTALGLLPWTIRNAARLGRFVTFDVGGGSYSLLAATQRGTAATSVADGIALADALSPGFSSRSRDSGETEVAMRGLALAEIARNPFRFAGSSLVRLGLFWKPLWPLLLLSAFGLWFGRADTTLVSVACVAASFSAYAAIGGQAGYELGVAPVLDALAGCGAAALAARVARRKAAPRDASLERWSVRALTAWVGLLLALTAGVQVWALGDALRSRRPEATFVGPRVLAVVRDGSTISAGRWKKYESPDELRAKPLRNEGVRLLLAGRAEDALAAFRAAVTASPRTAQDRLNLCVALDRAGRRTEALGECDRAVALARGGPPELLRNALSSRDSVKGKRP